VSTTTYVVHGDALDRWIAERRRLGLDTRDEVRDGVHHVVPPVRASHGALSHRLGARLLDRGESRGLVTLGAFNLGTEQDYRVPDMGWIATPPTLEQWGRFLPTADVVVEMVTPGDDTDVKVPWYLARAVREVWKITPAEETVEIVGRDGLLDRSAVLGLGLPEIAGLLGWR
jgi:hypothetical protein